MNSCRESGRGITFSVLVMILSLFPFEAYGLQKGSIRGFVSDSETGLPLEGVSLSVEETEIMTTTDRDGYYLLSNLPPGVVRIRAQLVGFQSVVLRDQRVLAGRTQSIDINMRPTIIDIVDRIVEGESHPLKFDDYNPSDHYDTSDDLQELPADNYRDVIILHAGVSSFDNSSGSQYPVSIRGGVPSDNTVYMDGIDVKSYMAGRNNLDLPEAGIEQIDIFTGDHSRVFGDARSGALSVISREGGRAYSGRVRIETDGIGPDGSNYGYNRAQISVGGPVPSLKNRLSFFFSTDVTGYGDRHPRAGGFKGLGDDIEFLARLYSHNDEVNQFLGYDLDLQRLLDLAQANNPDMPLLNIEDYRTDGGNFPGRVVGNEGDATRIQARVTYRASKNIDLSGLFVSNRDQGFVYSPGGIFWNEPGNGVFRSTRKLGIIGYNHTLNRTAEGASSLQIRGSYQRHFYVQGSRFNLDADSPGFGEDLGFDDLRNILNYRFGSIPIFLEDLEGGDIGSLDEVRENYFYNVEVPTGRSGRNPFGIPNSGFLDDGTGYYHDLLTMKEDRADIRFDYERYIGGSHRIRTGANLKFWTIDYFSSDLTNQTFLDYYGENPNENAFYFEDRLVLKDAVIDLGLRIDSFSPGGGFPSILGDPDSPGKNVGRKTGLSARVGMSFSPSKWLQLRAGFSTANQPPTFTALYSSVNVDIYQQTNTQRYFGNPDLELLKSNLFELSLTALLSEDWIVDVVGYNRDFDNDLTVKYVQQNEEMPYLRIFTNTDGGYTRGIDATLRKRFNHYFSTEAAYSLSFSSAYGSGDDPATFLLNEGFFLGGDQPPLLTDQDGDPETPSLYDQKHSLAVRLDLRFPDDFGNGTVPGRILENTGLYVTLNARSGRPYRAYFDTGRTKWYSIADLRVTKDFILGDLTYTVFADVRNIFGRDNLSSNITDEIQSGVYGTGSPYDSGDVIGDAIDDLGIDDPALYTGPRRTDINGDGIFDELDDQEIIDRLDFNGDGTVSVDEELAMRILARGAFAADPSNFDIPRLFRLGFEVKF